MTWSWTASLISFATTSGRAGFGLDDEQKIWVKRSRNLRREEDAVTCRVSVGESGPLSEALIETHCERCTMVVGRSHKSKDEEFLFGSTSSRLIHEAKNRAVWVVE